MRVGDKGMRGFLGDGYPNGCIRKPRSCSSVRHFALSRSQVSGDDQNPWTVTSVALNID
jgi:hypothetical protein